jgi:hypothetical protein
MTDPVPTGTVIAQLTAYAEGGVIPGPGQTWDDVPEESRPPKPDEEKDD